MPGYPPSCVTDGAPAPYWYFQKCNLAAPLQKCQWTYWLDCRHSVNCPFNYTIHCDQQTGAQPCVWSYAMACASTSPALPTCPFDYAITCQ